MRKYRFHAWLGFTVLLEIVGEFERGAVSSWFLLMWIVCTSVYMLVSLRDYHRDKFRESWRYTGRCRHCGYPLRGLRGNEGRMSGDCPECGMPFS
jgi:hypothetical protein